MACSRRSDSRAREKNSRRKKKTGETRGGKLVPPPVFPVYNVNRSSLTAAFYYLNALNRLRLRLASVLFFVTTVTILFFLFDEVRPKVLWIHTKLIIVCRVCCGSKNCKSVLFCSIMISFETGLHLKKFPVNNSWFSSDVTKIQTPKSQGLLRFYLHLAEDLLKINFCASFQRDSYFLWPPLY